MSSQPFTRQLARLCQLGMLSEELTTNARIFLWYDRRFWTGKRACVSESQCHILGLQVLNTTTQRDTNANAPPLAPAPLRLPWCRKNNNWIEEVARPPTSQPTQKKVERDGGREGQNAKVASASILLRCFSLLSCCVWADSSRNATGTLIFRRFYTNFFINTGKRRSSPE